MPQILTAHIGNYPRIGEEKDQQRHRRALTHLQSGELSKHAFRDVEQSVIQETIREQIEVGLDEITDGLISWRDPISHMCRTLSGVKTSPLSRFFDTNFYYRAPVLGSRPKKTRPILAKEFQYAQSISHKPVRTVLTGPYTLACHTHGTSKPLNKKENRIDLFVDIIRDEIAQLIALGAQSIQIDEPSIAKNKMDWPLFQKTMVQLFEGLKGPRFWLAFYFSPLADLYTSLNQLPIQNFILDFTYDFKKLGDTVLSSSFRPTLGFGVVNSRATRMDAIDPLINLISKWIGTASPESVLITPSAGLEYLPRSLAKEKLMLVEKIKSEIKNKLTDIEKNG